CILELLQDCPVFGRQHDRSPFFLCHGGDTFLALDGPDDQWFTLKVARNIPERVDLVPEEGFRLLVP
ncbi:MAG: hypothetical protein PHX57_12345, partial [Desulfobulbaceae bacterium]|nr:hypothetical protein [Desulfobulbaceae bacterium]